MSTTRDAILAAARAASRRAEALGRYPVNAANVAGLLLEHSGNTTRARDILDSIAGILRQIDYEAADEDRGRPGIAKAAGR